MSNLSKVQFRHGLNVPGDVILANIARNLDRDMPSLEIGRAVIVGGGPSAADYIDEIKALQAHGWRVFALNGSARWLRRQGINPDYHVILDAGSNNRSFVAEPHTDTTYLLASQCDPSLFDALAGYNVRMFHVNSVPEARERIGNRRLILGCGSTVGMQAINICWVMGLFCLRCYGFDSSHDDGAKHAYAQPQNADQSVIEVVYGGKSYRTSGPMAAQADLFLRTLPRWESLGMNITVAGRGLLPDMVSNRFSSTEQAEREKYVRMWTIPAYRHSRNEQHVEQIVELLGVLPGDRVLDFGSGSGKVAKALADRGADVLCIDIAPNAMDDEIHLPLCLATLWDLPNVRGAHGVCLDVMEHIPPDRVDQTLASIAHSVPQCYFVIDSNKDRCGAMIGETLHLTVCPPEWWGEKLEQHWEVVQHRGDGTFVCQVPRKTGGSSD